MRRAEVRVHDLVVRSREAADGDRLHVAEQLRRVRPTASIRLNLLSDEYRMYRLSADQNGTPATPIAASSGRDSCVASVRTQISVCRHRDLR